MTIGKIVGATKTSKCVVVTILSTDKFTVGERACVAFVDLDCYDSVLDNLGECVDITKPIKGVCELLSKI